MTERARGLGRKTREETGKGNQMTALRFQTGGGGGGDIWHSGLPLGGVICAVEKTKNTFKKNINNNKIDKLAPSALHEYPLQSMLLSVAMT